MPRQRSEFHRFRCCGRRDIGSAPVRGLHEPDERRPDEGRHEQTDQHGAQRHSGHRRRTEQKGIFHADFRSLYPESPADDGPGPADCRGPSAALRRDGAHSAGPSEGQCFRTEGCERKDEF